MLNFLKKEEVEQVRDYERDYICIEDIRYIQRELIDGKKYFINTPEVKDGYRELDSGVVNNERAKELLFLNGVYANNYDNRITEFVDNTFADVDYETRSKYLTFDKLDKMELYIRLNDTLIEDVLNDKRLSERLFMEIYAHQVVNNELIQLMKRNNISLNMENFKVLYSYVRKADELSKDTKNYSKAMKKVFEIVELSFKQNNKLTFD